MKRIFLPAVIALASLLPSRSLAGTETIYLIGCRGVVEGNRTYCEGNCNRTCAKIVREENPLSAYPDELTTYDWDAPTFQSACIFLGTNQDGTVAYIMLP
ncbi:MAG: hypothetical protein KatS3mg038_0064 [Candidatus Kapaibacterium sp.]|nr:MAG: hypothetical protein KatS3mg038_0064 [Candidatus Kapabacteria bacterium]